MINISVCDDSEYDIELVKTELEKYSQKKHVNFNINTFTNAKAVQYELTDGTISDIYILDVSMPNIDGFQLADDIRKFTSSAVIMFLTSMEDQAINGYKSKALRYIIKLNLKDDLEEALDSAIAEITKSDEVSIALHYYSDIRKVPYSDIIYVNRISRQLSITTSSQGELTDNRGITDFFETLNDNRFIFIDRSCFVNIDYVSQIDGYNLKLKSGQILPISRRQLPNVKQTIIKQWGM
ncbi:MAG: LytTR family DNA-binding domain-containing protein [Ruminococcus flavefaciens]|nr:LytTR family DNA-binding domain-containing protein [Ruminococcus flavefaciens]